MEHLDGDYLNSSGADAIGTGEEYINNEAEQKTQTGGAGGGGLSGRHTEPTPSETEAANILTTIKSGDLLRNSDSKTDGSANTTTITMTTLASPTSVAGQNAQDNVKILFSSEPANKAGTVSNKSVQKPTMVTYTNSNTGDLDALASAALQASSGTSSLSLHFIEIVQGVRFCLSSSIHCIGYSYVYNDEFKCLCSLIYRE